MWFPLRHEPPGWTGPWTFTSVNELPDRSVADTWSILLDDTAWCHWHPEVTDIQWQTGDLRGVGATRTVVFTGSVTIREEFDVWEDHEPDNKKFGFCITATTRPVWLGNRAAREEFRVEALSSSSSGTEGAATATTTTTKGSKFTRTFTVDPSFAARYLLGFMVYPYLSNLFEHECPRRFDQMYNHSNGSYKKKTK
jgi:hypothetical protein